MLTRQDQSGIGFGLGLVLLVLVALLLGRWTYDQNVVGSTRGRIAVKWLLLGWVTVCRQVNHLGIQPTTMVNSALHPSGVGKSSTGLSGWRFHFCHCVIPYGR